MPTYEYICKQCGHLFEIVQSMKDDTLTECPQCGGELRKVFAPPAIAFKGSGFYATDHGKKAKPAPKEGQKEHQKESKKDAASGGSETKTPEKKSETTTKTSSASSTTGPSGGSSGTSGSDAKD